MGKAEDKPGLKLSYFLLFVWSATSQIPFIPPTGTGERVGWMKLLIPDFAALSDLAAAPVFSLRL